MGQEGVGPIVPGMAVFEGWNSTGITRQYGPLEGALNQTLSWVAGSKSQPEQQFGQPLFAAGIKGLQLYGV